MVAASLSDRSGGGLVQPTFGNIRLSLDVATWNRPRTWPTSWATSHRAFDCTMAAPGCPAGWVAQPSRCRPYQRLHDVDHELVGADAVAVGEQQDVLGGGGTEVARPDVERQQWRQAGVAAQVLRRAEPHVEPRLRGTAGGSRCTAAG